MHTRPRVQLRGGENAEQLLGIGMKYLQVGKRAASIRQCARRMRFCLPFDHHRGRAIERQTAVGAYRDSPCQITPGHGHCVAENRRKTGIRGMNIIGSDHPRSKPRPGIRRQPVESEPARLRRVRRLRIRCNDFQICGSAEFKQTVVRAHAGMPPAKRERHAERLFDPRHTRIEIGGGNNNVIKTSRQMKARRMVGWGTKYNSSSSCRQLASYQSHRVFCGERGHLPASASSEATRQHADWSMTQGTDRHQLRLGLLCTRPACPRVTQIKTVVEAAAPGPVNVLLGPASALGFTQLAEPGVRRIGTGGALALAAWSGFAKAAGPPGRGASSRWWPVEQRPEWSVRSRGRRAGMISHQVGVGRLMAERDGVK